MRVGFAPVTDRYSGGIFQYSISIMEALRTLDDVDVTVYADDPTLLIEDLPEQWQIVGSNKPIATESRPGRSLWEKIPEGRVKNAIRRVRSSTARPSIEAYEQRYQREAATWRVGVKSPLPDVMLFPAPDGRSFSDLPFIMAIHDLQHRLQRHWPEVSAGGEWEAREALFRNAAKRAAAVLVDSEVGREDVLDSYGSFGLTKDRVWVLPFVVRSLYRDGVALREGTRQSRLALPPRYFFYPAQFWPHKNHILIVRALAILKKEGMDVPTMVFSGDATGEFRRGTFETLMDLARSEHVADRIIHLDYVADEDMIDLYSSALALVMPTFFGPTNIPILEAWHCDCPVITSDLRGIREQVQDAALLVDPTEPRTLADAMRRLIEDETLRGQLMERGRQRLTAFTQEDFSRTLSDVLDSVR